MARHSKLRGKQASPAEARANVPPQSAADSADDDSPRDPIAAFPADPPRRNLPLLILAAVFFAAWFCYLAYVALGM